MDKKLMLGIDEAGMGPVIGPLIISGVVVKKENAGILKEIGVKDSKMFGSGLKAHGKREAVWKAAGEYVIREKQVVINAREIDMNNMYSLHIEATRSILIDLGWKDISVVYIEQIGGMKKETCFKRLGFSHKGFVYEQKADIKYPAVSLASIKAKIVRDSIMSKLCEKLGEDYISGYPNNRTEEFLRKYYKNHGCLPPETRISRNWAPINDIKRMAYEKLKNPHSQTGFEKDPEQTHLDFSGGKRGA
ncbi:MAG: ribonuclease HII [Elusimicrobiota bacterium]